MQWREGGGESGHSFPPWLTSRPLRRGEAGRFPLPAGPAPSASTRCHPAHLICGEELLDLPSRFRSAAAGLSAKVQIRFPHLLHFEGTGTTSQVASRSEAVLPENQVTTSRPPDKWLPSSVLFPERLPTPVQASQGGGRGTCSGDMTGPIGSR